MLKKKNRDTYLFFQYLGILLIVSSSICIGCYKLRTLERRKIIEQEKEEFIKKSNEEMGQDIYDSQTTNSVNEDKDEQKLKSNAIGYIEIKKINIILPIFKGTSNEILRDGVGVLEEMDTPTDEKNSLSVIAAHRGGYNGEQTFLNIDKLEKGDKINIITDSKELIYRVIDQEVIEKTDWSKFIREEDKSKLILITCHPYPKNTQRLLVKSELVEVKMLQ